MREAAPFTGARTSIDLARFLIVGNDPVIRRGDYLQVGRVAFRIDEIRD